MSDSNIENIKVFVSYSHDSPEHMERVLRLADRLRRDGIDCLIDQYEMSPREGWPRWTMSQIEAARFVLVVCTEIYHRRVKGIEEIGKGLGVKWEGAIITQELYDSEANNDKFIPVLFAAADSAHIPVHLRGATRYVLDDGYEVLYRHLTNQPKYPKPALGARRSMPPLDRKEDFQPVSESHAAGRPAEAGIMVIHVADAEDEPVAGVVLSNKGDGTHSDATDSAGITRLALPKAARPNDWIHLQVHKGTAGNANWILISPWDGRVAVPPFDNKPDQFVAVVVAKKFDKRLLANPDALRAMAEIMLSEIAPKTSGETITEAQRRAVLIEVAKKYGLGADEIDQAIRAWGEQANDPYEKGLAALYEQHYRLATELLTESRKIRKSKLEKDKAEVVDVDMRLGQSLYEQGKYQESANIYREAADLRPDDATIMNNLALSLTLAGSYADAGPLYKRALAIDEKALGPHHPGVATDLNNLAGLYVRQGKYAEAEPLFKRALTILEKALGDDHPNVATVLENYAALLRKLNRENEAAEMKARAKAIRAKHQ